MVLGALLGVATQGAPTIQGSGPGTTPLNYHFLSPLLCDSVFKDSVIAFFEHSVTTPSLSTLGHNQAEVIALTGPDSALSELRAVRP